MYLTRREFMRMAVLLPFAHWGGKVQSPLIRILNYNDQKTVVTLPLEVYLRYVVPAEMPCGWPQEALKAQAIACRSYAWYACKHPRHSLAGADVCDSPRHCQLFRRDIYAGATDKAIRQTHGLICTLGGKVAETMYHACCGGHTIEHYHVNKIGEAVPYLPGVECPCGRPKEGHGIGLCQWGAFELAKSGFSDKQIIEWYYKGVMIEPMEAK